MRSRLTQGGSALLEVLIAVLIFSLGVIAIVGLQGAMFKATSDAKYRTEAGLYANRLLGEMWAADRSASLASFATGGGNYSAWFAEMQNTSSSTGLLGLPGAAANPPTVTVTPVNGATGFLTRQDVTITVRWQAPGDAAKNPVHQHVVSASISAD